MPLLNTAIDPASAEYKANEAEMAEVIAEFKAAGLTVLLSEQNLHFAKLVSDKAYIIESGEMRYEGTIAELEANAEVREKYLAV